MGDCAKPILIFRVVFFLLDRRTVSDPLLLSMAAASSPQPTVTITVGTENSKLTIHKQFISYHSAFFDSAFKSHNFIEG